MMKSSFSSWDFAEGNWDIQGKSVSCSPKVEPVPFFSASFITVKKVPHNGLSIVFLYIGSYLSFNELVLPAEAWANSNRYRKLKEKNLFKLWKAKVRVQKLGIEGVLLIQLQILRRDLICWPSPLPPGCFICFSPHALSRRLRQYITTVYYFLWLQLKSVRDTTGL